jgi:hypothetical protein
MTLALDFDGADDVVTATVVDPATTAFTFGAWINPDTIGETTGRIFDVGAQYVWYLYNVDGAVSFIRGAATTNLQCVSASAAWVATEWRCVFLRWDGGGNARTDYTMYAGSLSAAVASVGVSETGSSDGSGATTSATAMYWGNRAAGDRAFDGRVARPFIVPWQMSLAEMDAYRLGSVGVLFAHGRPRVFLPYASAKDLSGTGAHGTVTGAVAAEGPPIPMRWTA